jgi:hypothetical protein
MPKAFPLNADVSDSLAVPSSTKFEEEKQSSTLRVKDSSLDARTVAGDAKQPLFIHNLKSDS